MAKTIDELKAQANQIKNETAQGANTSQRIGLMNLDIVEKIEEERSNTNTKFSELEQIIDISDYPIGFLNMSDLNVGDTLPQFGESAGSTRYVELDCQVGQTFYYKSYAGGSWPYWVFIDDNRVITMLDNIGTGWKQGFLETPDGATKLIIMFATLDAYPEQRLYLYIESVNEIVKYTLENNKALNDVTKELKTINDDIPSIKEAISDLKPITISEYPIGFLNMSGLSVGDLLPQFGTSAGRTRYVELPCQAGQTFIYNSYSGGSWPYWVFINEQREIVKIDTIGTGWRQGNILAPIGASKFIIMFATLEGYPQQYLYAVDANSSINELNKAIVHINDEKYYNIIADFSNYNISHNYFEGTSMVLTPNPNCDMTDYVSCKEGDEFVYQGKGINSVVVGFSSSKGEGAVSLLTGSVDQYINKKIIIPKGVNYVRAWSRNNDHTVTPSKLYFVQVKEVVKADENAHDEVIEKFQVSVNASNPYKNGQFENPLDKSFKEDYKEYIHDCYFKAPKGNGKCKLVISCPGGGILAENWYSYMNIGKILNSLGYAVLCVTGYSQEWATDNNVVSPVPCGSWMATEEVLKAYKYIIDKYPFIEQTGCYLYGESQGGMIAENVAEETNIPILATVLDSPAISIQYAQMYIPARATSVKALYDMENHNFDANKCRGCDPFTRGMSEDIIMDEEDTLPSIDINSITAKKNRLCNSPVLMLTSENDTTISHYVHLAYAKALANNSFPVEVKLYSNAGHGVIQYTSVIGDVNGVSCTSALAIMLEFFKRNGGYSFLVE